MEDGEIDGRVREERSYGKEFASANAESQFVTVRLLV